MSRCHTGSLRSELIIPVWDITFRSSKVSIWPFTLLLLRRKAFTQKLKMFCSISGGVPKEPVISRKSGHLFERKLIERALLANGNKCPETGHPLTKDDLIDVKAGIASPIPPEKSSVPDVLKYIQSEWEGLVLELHSTKKELHRVRQELATALYRYDASLKTIARLEQEREEGESAKKRRKVNGNPQKGGDANENSEEKADVVENAENEAPEAKIDPNTLPIEALKRTKKKGEELQQMRKSRKLVASVNLESIKAIREDSSVTIDVKSGRISALSIGKDGIYAGCENGKIARVVDMQIGNTVTAHESEVTGVDFAGDIGLSGAKDGVVKVWDSGLRERRVYNGGSSVVHVQRHPAGIHFHCFENGFSWHDAEVGTTLASSKMMETARCASIHPDGMVFAIAGKGIGMWDMTTMQKVVTLGETTVNALAMSEKGYYMVACGEQTVDVWDLRKRQVVGSVDAIATAVGVEQGGEVGCAVGESGLSFFAAKKRAAKAKQIAWPQGNSGRVAVVWDEKKSCIVGDGAGVLHRYTI